jgi:hypothetical protein
MFRDPTAETAIQAAVQVTNVATTNCSADPEPTVAWAMLGARFLGGEPRAHTRQTRFRSCNRWLLSMHRGGQEFASRISFGDEG